MAVKRRCRPQRKRIGKVSYYFHHGGSWVYYLDGDRQVRRRTGPDEETAATIAAQVNAQLATAAPTMFSFQPLAVPELCREFLDHHEHVLRSSVATIYRYRTALAHLEAFAGRGRGPVQALQIDADRFVRYLRSIDVAPNGHKNASRRKLRDKGVLFILEVCRNLYGYAARKRHLPPYTENPFGSLAGRRFRIEDAKRIFVFDAETELAFLKAAGPWEFPIFFTLAKTGVRSGELIHLLVEDLDLDGGCMHIRDKPDLGWRIKTRRDRSIPLADELVALLRHVVGVRAAGPVFLRERFGTSSMVLAAATCPKSFRHSFATLLQDANVDLLIRQITLGHAPAGTASDALGMTSIYTHTCPETQRQEILRAVRLWPASWKLAASYTLGTRPGKANVTSSIETTSHEKEDRTSVLPKGEESHDRTARPL